MDRVAVEVAANHEVRFNVEGVLMSTEPKSAPFGWIYIMHSAIYEENVFKVGATIHQPLERARQLSASSGVASPFVLAYKKHVAFPFVAEAKIHRKLDACRVHDSREFFRLPLHQIIREFDLFDETSPNRQPAEEMSTPWSELFSSFPDNGSPRHLTESERAHCVALRKLLAAGGKIH